MSDDRPQPAPPEILGAGETAPAPLTFRGRPTLPGGIVPTTTPPGGALTGPITPTMPVLERALLPLKPLPPPALPPPASAKRPSFSRSAEPSLPSFAHEPSLDGIDDGPPATLPSASLDSAAQAALAAEAAPVAIHATISVGEGAPTPLPAPSGAPFDVHGPGVAAFDVYGPGAPPFDTNDPGSALDAVDLEPTSKPPSSTRRQIAIAPNLPQIPKPVSLKPMQHAPGIVSTQAIPLTVPARRARGSPLVVALLFALVGGAIALVVLLVVKPKSSAQAAGAPPGEGPAITSAEPATSVSATPATATPTSVATAAPAATEGPAASAAPSVASGAGATATPSTSPPAQTTASARPSGSPASAAARPRPKSDRIED